MSKLTVITPCSRPNNLSAIAKTIDFKYVCEWIIVYDENRVSSNLKMFENHSHSSQISEYLYKESDSSYGNAQRNFGMTKVKNHDSYVYFLDDDNTVHKDLYTFTESICNTHKMFTFNQNNHGHISIGNRLFVGGLDTALYLIHYELCKNVVWHKTKHEADALFFLDCYNTNKDKYEYVDKVLCYYNSLR